MFLNHRAVQQIMAALKEKNVTVSDREVAFLGKKFILYLVLAHKEKSPEIKQLLLKQGGYILILMRPPMETALICCAPLLKL